MPRFGAMPPQLKSEQGETMLQLPANLGAFLDFSIRKCESYTREELDSSSSTNDEKAPPARSPQHRQRSVSFSSEVSIRPTIHLNDFSDDEIRRAFMNRHDFREVKQLIRNAIYLIRTGAGASLAGGDVFCSRGLEKWMDVEYGDRVKRSHQIALGMQRLLRRAGKSSPEMIAKAYRSYTVRSRKAAYRKALEDQTAASSRNCC